MLINIFRFHQQLEIRLKTRKSSENGNHPPTQLDTFPRTSLLDLVKASESLTSFLKSLQVRMKSLMLLGNTESVSEVISTN